MQLREGVQGTAESLLACVQGETPPPVRLLRGQKVTLFKGVDAMCVRRWGVSNNTTAEKASALPSETELSPSERSYDAAHEPLVASLFGLLSSLPERGGE